jgi:hypothetical protein
LDPVFLQSGVAVAALATLAVWIDRRLIPLWERSITALEQSSIVLGRAVELLDRAQLKE